MASTGEVWKLGHRPALDGVRGIAVLLVVLCHAGIPGLDISGSVGVTLFFTLSGFLITALLLEERQATGRIAFGAFWVRRAARLFPALLALVLFTAPLLIVAGRPVPALPVLGYFANWHLIGGGDLAPWYHTWTLAIEEQFYLAWPLLVAVMGWRWMGLLCTVGVGWAVVARLALWGEDSTRVYVGTDTRMDAMLLGAGLALLLVGSRRRRFPSWLAGLGLVGLVGLAFTGAGWFGYVVMPGLAATASLACIAGALGGEGPACLSWPVLRYLGARSYGIYLWNFTLVSLFQDTVVQAPAWVIVAGTLAMAELSWRFVEQPARQMTRNRVRSAVSSRAAELDRRACDRLSGNGVREH